jgi:tRNA A37 methylthiotransferase MiaB
LTSAYILGDPVDRKVKRQRLWQLKDLIKNKNYEFRKRLLGRSLDLVIEGGDGVLKGLTDNYIRVVIEKSNKAKKALVRVIRVTEDKTFGVVIK